MPTMEIGEEGRKENDQMLENIKKNYGEEAKDRLEDRFSVELSEGRVPRDAPVVSESKASKFYPLPHRLNHVASKLDREEPAEAVNEFSEEVRKTIGSYVAEQAAYLTEDTFDRFINNLSHHEVVGTVNNYCSDVDADSGEGLEEVRTLARNVAAIARNSALYERHKDQENFDLKDPYGSLANLQQHQDAEIANSVAEEALDSWTEGGADKVYDGSTETEVRAPSAHNEAVESFYNQDKQ